MLQILWQPLLDSHNEEEIERTNLESSEDFPNLNDGQDGKQGWTNFISSEIPDLRRPQRRRRLLFSY